MDQKFPICHMQVLYFTVNFPIYRKQKKKQNTRKNNMALFFVIMKTEISQYGSPKNSIWYTKVMNICHTIAHLNGIST